MNELLVTGLLVLFLFALLGSGIWIGLTMGVILPTVTAAGIDLIWFGIFIVIVVEMAQITPPVGFNLFVLQGMTKREITWIAKACMPYFFVMVLALLLLYWFPGLVTWMPSRM
jgi:TRAP-type C4-dicarboxylate transport system permease large subunit